MGDQYCGRQFFHGLAGGRMVSRWFKCIAFIMHCISNLMLPLIWQKVLVCDLEVGDPCFKEMEKAMATHSSTLAWKIPWTEEPGGLQSMGSQRARHDWATSLSLFTFMHWRRKWHPTPVFLPGESQGRESLVGCCLWGHTESDTTGATYQQQQQL